MVAGNPVCSVQCSQWGMSAFQAFCGMLLRSRRVVAQVKHAARACLSVHGQLAVTLSWDRARDSFLSRGLESWSSGKIFLLDPSRISSSEDPLTPLE